MAALSGSPGFEGEADSRMVHTQAIGTDDSHFAGPRSLNQLVFKLLTRCLPRFTETGGEAGDHLYPGFSALPYDLDREGGRNSANSCIHGSGNVQDGGIGAQAGQVCEARIDRMPINTLRPMAKGRVPHIPKMLINQNPHNNEPTAAPIVFKP